MTTEERPFWRESKDRRMELLLPLVGKMVEVGYDNLRGLGEVKVYRAPLVTVARQTGRTADLAVLRFRSDGTADWALSTACLSYVRRYVPGEGPR